jgi:hypothetical protein
VVREYVPGLAVSEYKSAGNDVKPERPGCPRCQRPMMFWSGYVRVAFDPESPHERHTRIRILRVHCASCRTAPGFLPACCLSRRLDEADVIGTVVASVASGVPVATEAEGQAIPRSTARGLIRRFAEAALGIVARFASLAIRLPLTRLQPSSQGPHLASGALPALGPGG